jgi:hypothetical protein
MQRTRNRVRALLVITQASALYTLAEILHATRGQEWTRLEHRLDALDDRMDDAEAACKADGDFGFVERVGEVTDRVSMAICRMTHPIPQARAGK